ncbi:hypothetical protein [Roseateles depolymerans]|uniref:Uncharacterized protein n=1 Tax=Roseateles depolymerans TaxID=76731 RepID=A0A0U3MZ01_9BURK|nr:hypothetical protein [Roseateles depolymerans]ALV05179.1 hypothetical protein RD2015_683 [Roseateles depolymerans]REG14805.1 hypothetical protein DES44_3302 [Roseateles depolymerans]
MQAMQSNQERPFDAFMGQWHGVSRTFDVDGNFLESTRVFLDVAWKDDETFRQVERGRRILQSI